MAAFDLPQSAVRLWDRSQLLCEWLWRPTRVSLMPVVMVASVLARLKTTFCDVREILRRTAEFLTHAIVTMEAAKEESQQCHEG